ncbi:MAG: type transport system ATP-binding protein, partial [Actinomycetota bacterium]
MRRVRTLVVALLGLAAAASVAPGRAADPACDHSIVPFAGLPGAVLTPTDHVSKDDPPVIYTRWRGIAPGFDGMPFSVDVTVPCGASGPRPLVTMLHGFTDDKTVWQETEKSDSVVSEGRPESNTRWNNIWFASRGYAVLNYTARGWNDSCGPDVAGAVPGVAPAAHCLAYQYWIHLDDKRWEVRDAQWLTSALVQSGVARPDRLAITGGSYGGAPTAMAALLGARTMCGASPVPVALGVDPCVGVANGELVPWTTPNGAVTLQWAAAVPLYTFADLIQVLAPNGRGTDGWSGAPPDGDHTDPFGVPIHSTVAGLLAAGQSSGFFAPPGVDPTADIFVDAGRLLAGNPFPQEDPLVARGIDLYRTFKSPITTEPVARVPIFWVQGFTDPLFPGTEALQMLARLRAVDPSYPIKVFLGDLGHDYTGQRQ